MFYIMHIITLFYALNLDMIKQHIMHQRQIHNKLNFKKSEVLLAQELNFDACVTQELHVLEFLHPDSNFGQEALYLQTLKRSSGHLMPPAHSLKSSIRISRSFMEIVWGTKRNCGAVGI
ncbi:hypothetical protein QVD17_17171 [Tagetes erecta]|uniref:Uncharacterized protein n=1 Tax=Tagetes erecta TaxID=13708 RepID=A0AAD8KSQ3_TARER|nr:hypothetical protein QVD17_17171 [Tagetes erecta]